MAGDHHIGDEVNAGCDDLDPQGADIDPRPDVSLKFSATRPSNRMPALMFRGQQPTGIAMR